MIFETYNCIAASSCWDNLSIVTWNVMVERILQKQKTIFLAITVMNTIFILDNLMHVWYVQYARKDFNRTNVDSFCYWQAIMYWFSGKTFNSVWNKVSQSQ